MGLSLLLLVFGVGLADHPHDAFSADDLAAFTDSPDACSDFHDGLFCNLAHSTAKNASNWYL
jgi:hypothetical protein